MDRMRHTGGMELWVVMPTLAEVTDGGQLFHGGRVRLKHLLTGRVLALARASDGTKAVKLVEEAPGDKLSANCLTVSLGRTQAGQQPKAWSVLSQARPNPLALGGAHS